MGPCSSRKHAQLVEYEPYREKPQQVVLLGTLGSGKTSLFNKLCGKQEKVKYGGASVTKQITISYSCKGNGFRLVDTPGFGAVSDRLAHSIGILAGLTEGPIVRILIVVKYDRIDLMEDQVNRICLIVGKYINLVTLIISHWDFCKEEDQISEQKMMNDKFKSKYKITSIIYSQLNSTPEQICQQIDFAITKISQNFELRETEFDVFFDNLDLNYDLACCKDQFSRDFNGFADTIKEFIFTIPQSQQELDEILHCLTVYIKEEAEQMLYQFELKAGQTMDQIYARTDSAVTAYLTHIELKKSIMATVQQLVELCQRRMLLSPNHPFKLLRKCNHCGEVWMKVQGCDGPTVCGEIPNTDEIMSKKLLNLKYRFVYKDNKITYTFVQQQAAQMRFNYRQGDKKMGCQKSISWSTMIPIDQKLMEEILKDQIFDFLCNKQLGNTVTKKWIINKRKMIEEAQKAIRIV